MYGRQSPNVVYVGRRTTTFPGWDEFKELLMLQLRSSQEGNLYEQLMSLLETSIIQEYHRQFKMISAPLRGVSQSVLEAAFVNGLRPNI